MAGFVARFADDVRPCDEAADKVGVVALAASVGFWSAFNLLGILFTRDSLWLATDDAAAVVAGAEGCAVDAEDSLVASLCAVSARLLRTPCTGPVLRARALDGDTEPAIIHATNVFNSVKRVYISLTRMWALPNIGGALCSTPQSLADAHY